MQFYGFDTTNLDYLGIKNPEQYADIMSYGKYLWISSYTYEALLTKIGYASSHSAATFKANYLTSSIDSKDFFIISGAVDTINNTGALDNLYRIQSNITDLPGIGNYSIEFQNASGYVLLSQSFNLSFGTEGKKDTGFFVELIPYDVNVSKIFLKNGSSMLASVDVNGHSPQVNLTYPNGGEIIDNIFNVTWNASDSDGGVLHYNVEYSHDNGSTWNLLALDTNQTNYTIYPNDLPGSTQALIKITASDGVNTGSDQSDSTFSIPDKKPTVIITNPSNGSEFLIDRLITLRGAGYDPEYGMLTYVFG